MSARAATSADVQELRDLYAEFHAFHVQALPGHLRSPKAGEVDPDEFARKVGDILESNDAVMLVVELDGRVVGFAEAYIREISGNPYRQDVKYGFLQSLGVAAPLRGQGLGRSLVAAVEDWARAHGATELRTEAWEFACGPLRFYERLGYTTFERKLVRSLGD